MASLRAAAAALESPPRSPALHQLWRRMLLIRRHAARGVRRARSLPGAAPGGALSLGPAAATWPRRWPARPVRPARPDSAGPQGHRPRRARAGCRGDQVAGRAAAPDCRSRLKGETQLLAATAQRPPAMRPAPALPPAWRARRASQAELALNVLDERGDGQPSRSWPARPRAAARLPVPRADRARRRRAGASTRPSRRCWSRWPATRDPMPACRLPQPKPRCASTPAPRSRRRHLPAPAEPSAQRAVRLRREPPTRCCAARPVSGRRGTQAPELKARLMRALLDEARRAGIRCRPRACWRRCSAYLWPSPRRQCSRAGIEVALAAGEFDAGARWAETAPHCSTGWR